MTRIQIKKELREYQKEALDYALRFDSSICVLPTGTGKTLIGIAWAIELLNKGIAKRILVLEPSRFLVEQTYKAYLDNTTLSKKDVNIVYGIFTKEEREREEIWKKGIVVICTPNTAINDIHLLKDFDAVVIDECHHTTGKHAYTKLLSNYNFKYKLGLTATLSEKVRKDVETFISNNIRVWTWEELKEKYPQYKFPDWIGEIYDSELNEEEINFLKHIETSPLPPFSSSFCLRTFTRDGALALRESVYNPKNELSKMFPTELKDKLSELRELHKIEALENILNEHDFEKAIIFVDRVCIANKIFEKFRDLNPILFLGRLRMGFEKQKEVLEEAGKPEHKIIISTSAGEEGIDLPTADLLIIWSNVASPIRFIQRHGRIMRPSEKLKVVTFIATPGTPEINSPDYDSLVDGLILAKENGLDIAGLEDEEFIRVLKTKSFRNRIRTLLESDILKSDEILDTLGFGEKGKTKVNKWLSNCIKEKNEEFRICYFYFFDYKEIEKEIREKFPPEKLKKLLIDRESKNFFINWISRKKLSAKNRFYFLFQKAEEIEFESGFSQYFPLPKNLEDDIFLDFRIDTVTSRKNILEGFFHFYYRENKFKVFLQLGEKTIEFTESEFKEIIKKLYQFTGEEYVKITLYNHGKHDFLPSLYFNGRFSEKTLELVFRNTFYVLLNMKKLIQSAFS